MQQIALTNTLLMRKHHAIAPIINGRPRQIFMNNYNESKPYKSTKFCRTSKINFSQLKKARINTNTELHYHEKLTFFCRVTRVGQILELICVGLSLGSAAMLEHVFYGMELPFSVPHISFTQNSFDPKLQSNN